MRLLFLKSLESSFASTKNMYSPTERLSCECKFLRQEVTFSRATSVLNKLRENIIYGREFCECLSANYLNELEAS